MKDDDLMVELIRSLVQHIAHDILIKRNEFNNWIDKRIYISNKGFKREDMFVVQIEDGNDIIWLSISKEYRDRFRFEYDDVIKEIEEPKEQKDMEFEDYREAMKRVLDVDGRQKNN